MTNDIEYVSDERLSRIEEDARKIKRQADGLLMYSMGQIVDETSRENQRRGAKL